MDKQQLRAEVIAARKAMPGAAKQEASERIVDRLLSLLDGCSPCPAAMLAYRSMPSEVATQSLFHLPDYRMYAPVTHRHDHMEWRLVSPVTHWRPGLFGVHEPTAGPLWSGDEPTVLIMPLAAFDRRGNRLGMGKGCFDYWLADAREHLQAVIGLAFGCQEVAQVPAEGHDVPMDFVITEREVVECQRS